MYNEVGTDTLAILAEAISNLDSVDEIVVLGDFNLYHPMWSTEHRRPPGPSVQPLLTIVETSQLQLLTVPGTPTHRWGNGESTIDLTFASEDIAQRVVYCKIDDRVDCDSDHLPIGLAIDWSWQPATPAKKRLWSKTNETILQQTVHERLNNTVAAEPKDEEAIDRLISDIVGALNAGIDASTPWANPSARSIPGFDDECKAICREVQQLRRYWQRTRQEDDYEAYRQACNRKGRHIRKALRTNHRQRVESASESQNGLGNW